MRNGLILLPLSMVLVMTSGSVLPGQTPATRAVMREKLAHSENILDAIMTSDFALLTRESTALGETTKSPAWQVLETPQYARYSSDFLRATQDLIDAGKDRDLDAAAIRYAWLTMTCYQCHRYMKGLRLAQ